MSDGRACYHHDDDPSHGSWCYGSPVKRKDTRKRVGDRHKPGYQRDYMRRYRAKLKARSATLPKAANSIA